MMDDELVEMLLETVRQKTAELSPEEALKVAQEILEGYLLGRSNLLSAL